MLYVQSHDCMVAETSGRNRRRSRGMGFGDLTTSSKKPCCKSSHLGGYAQEVIRAQAAWSVSRLRNQTSD